jgi:hypothetical protein
MKLINSHTQLQSWISRHPPVCPTGVECVLAHGCAVYYSYASAHWLVDPPVLGEWLVTAPVSWDFADLRRCEWVAGALVVDLHPTIRNLECLWFLAVHTRNDNVTPAILHNFDHDSPHPTASPPVRGHSLTKKLVPRKEFQQHLCPVLSRMYPNATPSLT